MAKQDLTHLSEDEQLKCIHTYIKQRSFHKNQRTKIDANDLISRFKHKKFQQGNKRIKFFNNLLVKTVNKFGGIHKEYQSMKITILRT